MPTKYTSQQIATLGHIVQLNNMQMHNEEYGVFKPLVLLQGFGG